MNVESLSEIAIDYKLIISNVPVGLKVKVDNNIYEADSGVITVNNLGSFEANDNNSTHQHLLKFMVLLGSDTISNRELKIDVIFTQKAL